MNRSRLGLHRKRSRHAFTLVEVVVAASLGAIVMLSIFSALDVHWRVTGLGDETVELARKKFIVSKKMKSVLQNEVAKWRRRFVLQQPSHGSLFAPIELHNPQTSDRGGNIQTDSIATDQRTVRFVGWNDRFEFHYMQALDRLDEGSKTDPVPFRKVHVGCSQQEADVLQIESRFALDSRVSSSTNATHLDHGNILSLHGISNLAVRYYDGRNWASEWDSKVDGVPVLIEIRLSLSIDSNVDRDRAEFESIVFMFAFELPAFEAPRSKSV